MALKYCRVFLIILTCSTTGLSPVNSAREIPIILATLDQVDEGSILECWNAHGEIKSCTNEIVAYFTIGKIDIDLPCCQAISVITHHCWPTMLSTLGFTPEQTNILRGYCDASKSATTNVSSNSTPAPSPSPLVLPLDIKND
ncbi:PREDICTED: egg cell-secreted protein 1.4-like [Nicotiana attenuata]|uniref:egg cell-secreted protein 1.4-like n=1 Tax=Nicotiana attenuata TaxID=49451 RepID=UPI000904C6C5|nr:PREDICTED: egg cell-secreted protein 1.4-like [Nicotiana attenuata]